MAIQISELESQSFPEPHAGGVEDEEEGDVDVWPEPSAKPGRRGEEPTDLTF
jgi:hypothetical protein